MSEHVREMAWALKVLAKKVGKGKRVEAARKVLFQRFGVRNASELEWYDLRRLVMHSEEFLADVDALEQGKEPVWAK